MERLLELLEKFETLGRQLKFKIIGRRGIKSPFEKGGI
jgi:hypothetical protein